MDDWVIPVEKPKRFTHYDANKFLIGVLFNQNVKAEVARNAAEWFNDSLGDHDDPSQVWNVLLEFDKPRLMGFLRYGYRGKAFHRFYKRMAENLCRCAVIINEQYGGDPSNIWKSQRSAEIVKVRKRFEKLPGIGSALSRMAVLILVRNHGLIGGKDTLAQLDVKPDVHLKRVFSRTGLIKKKGSNRDANRDVISAAKKLSPKFPAILDAPAWEIGKKFCTPNHPDCNLCPLDKACPKVGL